MHKNDYHILPFFVVTDVRSSLPDPFIDSFPQVHIYVLCVSAQETVLGAGSRDVKNCPNPAASLGLPGGSAINNPPVMQEAQGTWVLFPGSGRSPRGGHSNPLQYSCQENPVDRGAWRAAVRGVTKSETQLSDSHKRQESHLHKGWFL